MPVRRSRRGQIWSRKDDVWVREQVERNLQYVIYRALLDHVGAYSLDEYDPELHGEWESAAPAVWEWLREVFCRMGAAHHLPRLRRALHRVLEEGAPIDLRESQAEVDRAVERQHDDEWGFAIVDALMRGPEVMAPAVRGNLLEALLAALEALARSADPPPDEDEPTYSFKPYEWIDSGPVARTGPPASTWASRPQVLPQAA